MGKAVPVIDSCRLPVKTVVLMSGSGSNAEALLRYCKEKSSCAFEITAIISDRPCRGEEIAGKWNLPYVCCDIFKFYAEHGESVIKLDTPHRRELREKWNGILEKEVMKFAPAFGLLAGFIPLTNLAKTLPLLNVHPGDLTITDENGKRKYGGLHNLPVEKALLDNFTALRSSVILVQPFTGNGGDDLDSGPVLGVSGYVDMPEGKLKIQEYQRIFANRTPGLKITDELREYASICIEKLKYGGDHHVFPACVQDFALGKFGLDEKGKLYYRKSTTEPFEAVRTVIYLDWESIPKPVKL